MHSLRRSLSIRLEALGIEPNRLLGQHFLVDEKVLERIVETAGVRTGDRVLEIGAGPGQLTACLLNAGAAVTAVEKDTRFLPLLAELDGPIRIVSQDARSVSFTELLPPEGPVRTVGNLPYYITTDLIAKCLIELPYAESHTFLIQTEAARRLVSGPGGKSYGPLNVMIQHYGGASNKFVVPSGAFLPPPHVGSTLLCLTRHPDRPPDRPETMQAFAEFLGRIFSTRRKTITATWKREFGEVPAERFEALGITPSDRIEILSPETIYRLFKITVD